MAQGPGDVDREGKLEHSWPEEAQKEHQEAEQDDKRDKECSCFQGAHLVWILYIGFRLLQVFLDVVQVVRKFINVEEAGENGDSLDDKVANLLSLLLSLLLCDALVQVLAIEFQFR